jgi:hypothetical protein
MSNYYSREARFARRTRRLAEYEVLAGVGESDERRLTTQTAPQHAIKVAREVLDGYRLPAMPKLSYSGMRNTKTATDSSKLEDGVITIFAEMKTISGINIGFDIPIEIRAGKILEPSVVVVEGAPRVIAQSTFDDLVERSTMHDTRPVRDMFSPPMPNDVANKAYSNRSKVTRVNTGMFSLGANRKALADAIAGRSASIKEASPEDYDSDTEHEPPDVERNQQDDDWLDPAERMEQHDLYAGQEVTLKEELEIGDRGGIRYDLTKGTKCTIVRDLAGDNKSFVVRFEDEGLEVIVERHFLKAAAPKNPPAPKAPPRTKAPPKPPKADGKPRKQDPFKKMKPSKVCHKCNQSPCVCHRKKAQPIQEVGVNIVNERFPGAINKLMTMVDLSEVELYRYKNTVAVSPSDDRYPEMFWDGKDWISMTSGVRIAQALEEIGVNIAQYQFPKAIKELMTILPDLSGVSLYKYKDTIAASPEGSQEIIWSGNRWVPMNKALQTEQPPRSAAPKNPSRAKRPNKPSDIFAKPPDIFVKSPDALAKPKKIDLFKKSPKPKVSPPGKNRKKSQVEKQPPVEPQTEQLKIPVAIVQDTTQISMFVEGGVTIFSKRATPMSLDEVEAVLDNSPGSCALIRAKGKLWMFSRSEHAPERYTICDVGEVWDNGPEDRYYTDIGRHALEVLFGVKQSGDLKINTYTDDPPPNLWGDPESTGPVTTKNYLAKKSQAEESFPFPPQFPKTCQVCNKTYNSMEEWQQLPPPSSGKTEWITDFEDYDIRNCACGSTLAVIVKRKVEDPELDEYPDDSENVQADVEPQEITADEDLVAKVNEEVGGMRDRGLGDIDIRQAIQSKYGDQVVESIFKKTAP